MFNDLSHGLTVLRALLLACFLTIAVGSPIFRPPPTTEQLHAKVAKNQAGLQDCNAEVCYHRKLAERFRNEATAQQKRIDDKKTLYRTLPENHPMKPLTKAELRKNLSEMEAERDQHAKAAKSLDKDADSYQKDAKKHQDKINDAQELLKAKQAGKLR